MGNNIKSNTTFWTEINSYKIQVPYYQRDYAQGRTDGGRIDNIREVFVEELYQAIKGKRLCHLGLVFGSYDTENSIFIAVDGQQRLTTVFLLHWYVAWRENKLGDYQKLSTNFSWDTRSYSSQFVELLFKINQSENVINAITTNCDYFSIWENDPTVKGMLTMLDEIEKQYPKDEDGLCQKLFSNDCNINYDILKLEKNSDGKTYLKMNSRGRSLTTFELFKSKFIDNYKPSFSKKFDEEWLSFMLNMSKEENGFFADPDISYMNFINEYTYLMLKYNYNEDSEEYKEFIDAKLKGNLTDIPFISFEKYTPAFKDVRDIELFNKILDWVITNYNTIKVVDDELRFLGDIFFIDEIIKSNNPNFSHRTKFFSLIKYAELTEFAIVNKTLYKRWNRVFRNLIENSNIDSSNIGNICQTINRTDKQDIYSYLSSMSVELLYFDKSQVNEEIAKAKQILDENGELRKYNGFHKKEDGSEYNTWENIITKVESFSFFKGAIRFLFQDENGETTEDSWNKFNTKWKNAKEFFSDENKYYNENKLLRTLIGYFDSWESFKKIYYDNRHWKSILLNKDLVKPVHNLLINGRICDFDNYSSSMSNRDKNIQEQLVKTNILDCIRKDKNYYMEDGGNLHSYYTNRNGDVYLGRNNRILLITNGISSNQRIEGYDGFYGNHIDFIYKKVYFFRWYGNPNDKELDVYLMEDNWNDYKKRANPTTEKNTEEDEWYCFRVTPEMEKNTNLFITALDRLIDEAKHNRDLQTIEKQ